MAERASTRTGSRRTTPQSTPQIAREGTQTPPNRTTRTTRSQSRGVSDNEDGKIGLRVRRGAKHATQDGTNGAVSQSGSKSRKGRPAKHAGIQQDLSIVAEDPSVVYPDLENAKNGGAGVSVEDAGAGQQLGQQNFKSPGGLSAFSGTTARISLPTQELTELSPEEMLDTIPDLSYASDRLLSLVIPAELSAASIAENMAQFQSKGTRENKKFKRLSDTFERQRKEYGGDSYINVGETLRRLLGRKAGPIDEQTASWRPDALLQKANIAILVSRMLSIAGQNQIDQFLEEIVGDFPRPFAHRLGLPESLTPECSALAESTLQLALEVRTQEAIMLLARHVGKLNFDLDSALLQVFYYDANNLKGWAVAGLEAADLGREAKDAILGRVEQLRNTYNSDGQLSGVESLQANFPWTNFAQQMITWAGQRLTEIEIHTTTHGGAQTICQGLVDVVHSGRLGQPLESESVDVESDGPEVRLQYDTPSESRATPEHQHASNRPEELKLPQFSADSNKVRIAAAHLKQRQADRKVTEATEQMSSPQNQEIASDVQVPSTAGPSMQALPPQRISNEQFNPSPAPLNAPNGQTQFEWDLDTLTRAQGSDAYRTRGEAESNKENVAEIAESRHTNTPKKRSMHARDPLAERVPPVDEQDLDSYGQEIEISSDEGFQAQAGPSNAAVQRRLKPATKRPASGSTRLKFGSPKRVRVQENIDAHISDGRTDSTRDEQKTELPPSQAYEVYVRANQSAKKGTAVRTKPPQRRSPWTVAETEMFHWLITEHGTSWKLLQDQDRAEQGNVLEARDQVALKDKARNMKMDYLKYVPKFSDPFNKADKAIRAGRILPQNFERIPLSQPQITRLRNGGIEYDPETGTRVDAEIDD